MLLKSMSTLKSLVCEFRSSYYNMDFTFLQAKIMNSIVVGIDEAGRGPWAGPVVAAAVILPYNIVGVDDSKKLSIKKREILFVEIMSVAKVGIGIASVAEIDQFNILAATMLAMQRAYTELYCYADLVLIDGNRAPRIEAKEVKTIIQGDATEPCISAASIIAKVTRDRIMQELDQQFPQYLWKKNSGYGTKAHLNAIKEHGVTNYHRKSFKPVKNFLLKA